MLTYSLELAEKREKKLILELEDWKQRASKEVEESFKENPFKNLILQIYLNIYCDNRL